jgi:hypothetical protein
MTTFWQGDLGKTIADACELADPMTSSPHLAAWLGGYDASAAVSSNVGSQDLPFQRWMKFKEAFSPKFVVDAIAAMPYTPRRCVDPFGGSGTTALTCSFLGIEAITIEVNPFLADLIEAKLKPPSAFELSASYEIVLNLARSSNVDINRHLKRLPPSFCEAPSSLREDGAGRFVFWRDALARILTLRTAIEACPDERSGRLLKVLLGSILVPASNVVVNGKGRRYRSGWTKRRVWADDVDRLFSDAVRRAARDLGGFGGRLRTSATLLRGDSRKLMQTIDPVDAAIFSPPYPNSFDYTDVYNLELWVLGYLGDMEANKALRTSTLRSHVQVAFEGPRLTPSGLLACTVDRLKEVRARLWDSRIPEMVLGYFEDTDAVIGALHTRMNRGGRVVMVVGDSRYAGVLVDVAAILRERSEALGFATVETREIRSMRSSAQHGGHYELAETCLVLERQ